MHDRQALSNPEKSPVTPGKVTIDFSASESGQFVQSLVRISRKLNLTLDVNKLLETLSWEVIELTHAEGGCAGLHTSEGMHCEHHIDRTGSVQSGYCWPPGVGWPGWLIAHKIAYCTNDALHDAQIVPEVRARWGVKSGISVPMLDANKEVIGFFQVQNKLGNEGFVQPDVEMLVAASHLASAAVQNALGYRRARALYSLTQSLAVAVNLDEICEAVAAHIVGHFRRPVTILLSASGSLTPRFRSPGFDPDERGLEAAARVFENGRRAGRWTGVEPAAEAHYLPLKTRSEVIGVLGVRVEAGDWFSVEDRQLLEVFAGQAAMAIQRGLLGEQARRAQIVEETGKMRRALLDSVSHDLRSPLASIVGSLSSLLDGQLDLDQDSRRKLLEAARLEAGRLDFLLKNLLDMSRLEAGLRRVKTEPCDVLDVIGVALTQLGGADRQRRVSVDVPWELPLVAMDSALVTQVVVNLLSNALRYTPPDQAVELRARVTENWLQVMVVDQGCGVAEADLGHVFEEFYQGRKGDRRGGAGLGLSICKAFIEAHGGEIRMENGPRCGCVVTFTLPVRAGTSCSAG